MTHELNRVHEPRTTLIESGAVRFTLHRELNRFEPVHE
jgi:hypothetical protein